MIISIFVILPIGLLSISVLVLLVEVSAAFFLESKPKAKSLTWVRPTVAIVVPAHNEAVGILTTLSDIRAQLTPFDRILVVADNCSDDTAIIATKAGVEVSERKDPLRIGKGYALDWGIQILKQLPPAVVVFLDADCRLADNAINELVVACSRTSRPVQSLYLMSAPEEAAINYQVAEFAWRVKNLVRPLGLLRLDLPCQLMGTGMAFPWSIIRNADLASGEIVEDMKLGLDLAQAGHAPYFCPTARLFSVFPSSSKGAHAQRQRWEHGHLATITYSAPKFLMQAIKDLNLDLLAMTLDLIIPPISLLCLLLIAGMLLGVISFVFSLSSIPLYLSIANLVVFALAMFLCWLKAGTDILPLISLPKIGYYVLTKVPLYHRIFSRKAVAKWVRAERDGHAAPRDPD